MSKPNLFEPGDLVVGGDLPKPMNILSIEPPNLFCKVSYARFKQWSDIPLPLLKPLKEKQ